MPTPVVMPQLGEAVAEGTIERWLKSPGERVQRFEALVEVMTEKVNTEIPSPLDGVVEEIVAAEGETVKVGATIALIREEASLPVAEPSAPAAMEQPAVAPPVEAAPAPPAEPAVAGLFPSSDLPAAKPPSGPEPSAPAAARPAAAGGAFSPAVRRLAAEYGLDLRDVHGTGAGGRITREDVLAHAHRRRVAARPQPEAVGGSRLVVPSALRRAIAQRMVESTHTIPHAWMMVEADVTGLVRLRQAVRSEFQRREGFDLTYFPFFVKAVVEGLRAQPTLNASWMEEGIVYHQHIHLGVAVSTEEGLVVPVLRSADGMSVAGLARAIRELADRARTGDLGPEEMQGGTFTANNTGALGSVVSVPIINPPQSGIITLETIQARPAVLGEGIAIRQMVNLSFSFDHRVADGLTAGRFMQQVRSVMEAFSPGDPVY